MAIHAFKDAKVRPKLVELLGKEIAKEVKSMCSEKRNSVLRLKSQEALYNFKWETLMNELQETAPSLHSVLETVVQQSKVRRSTGKRPPIDRHKATQSNHWHGCSNSTTTPKSQHVSASENHINAVVLWAYIEACKNNFVYMCIYTSLCVQLLVFKYVSHAGLH